MSEVKIDVNSPYFSGISITLVFKTDINLIIGDIPGAKCLCEKTEKIKNNGINLNENKELLRKVICSESQQFKIDQKKEDTLKTCLNSNDHNIRNGFDKVDSKNDILCLPLQYRKIFIEIEHDNYTGGHMISDKTQKRIENYFHWPGMETRNNKYCLNLFIITITLLLTLSTNPFKN